MKSVSTVLGIVFAAVLAAVIGVRLSPVGRAMVLGVIMGATTGTVITALTMVLVMRGKTNRSISPAQAAHHSAPDVVFVAGEPTRVVFPSVTGDRRLRG